MQQQIFFMTEGDISVTCCNLY